MYSTVKRLLPNCVKHALKTVALRVLRFLQGLPVVVLWRGKGLPIPPLTLRERAGSGRIKEFIRAGKRRADSLIETVSALGRSFDDFDHVVDFGCGCGRTFGHLYGRYACKLYGCDVDQEAISWMKRSYPRAHFEANRFAPPLPFETGKFDLVFSVSVFTHLDEMKQFEWLAELNRVLKVGGIALLTVHGNHALEQFLSGRMQIGPVMTQALRAQPPLDEAGFIYQEYPGFSANPEEYGRQGIEGSYGLAFHSKRYINTKWARFFEVMDVMEGAPELPQDLVILRKTAALHLG